MDTIKRRACALIVERLNNIGDVTQNFSSEGDASQFFYARILACGCRRALMMWIPLTHVLNLVAIGKMIYSHAELVKVVNS